MGGPDKRSPRPHFPRTAPDRGAGRTGLGSRSSSEASRRSQASMSPSGRCSFRRVVLTLGYPPTSSWLGALDDLWQLGKPGGVGGPWKDTRVKAGQPSDPYLMAGYDRKSVELSHHAGKPVTITREVDVTGTGLWVRHASLAVPPGQTVRHPFAAGYSAYWVRAVADAESTATVRFEYR